MANTKVTGDVIANGTISTVHIADDAITAAKLDSTASGITFADLAVDTNTLYVDAANNRVGIGETSPLSKLHIKVSDTGVTSPSAQGNLLVLEDSENGLSILSSTAGAGYINFGDSDDNNVGMIIYGHSSNSMDFWTNAGKRMTINSSGNVGIGTTSPSNKLSVCDSNGTGLEIAPNDSNAQVVLLAYDRADSAYREMNFNASDYIWRTSATERMRIHSSGNIVLGANGNQYGLVTIRQSGTSNDSGLAVVNSTNTKSVRLWTDGTNSYLSSGATGNGVLVLNAGGGNVGIGTSSPTEKLSVNGNISLNRYLSLSNSDYTYILGKRTSPSDGFYLTRLMGYGDNTFYGSLDVLRHDANDGEIRFRTRTADVITDVMTIVDGNVGIGETSPAEALTVVGTIRVQSASGDTDGLHISSDSNGDALINAGYSVSDLKFATADVERMRIQATTGNVGIGTTTPNNKLHVEINDTNTYDSTSINTPTIINSTRNSSNVSNQASIIQLRATGWAGSTTGVVNLAAIQKGNANTADFVIQTRYAGTYGERMRIDSVGVTTITRNPFFPAASLDDITTLKLENKSQSFGGSAVGIQLNAGDGDTIGSIFSRADGNDNTTEALFIITNTDNPIIFGTNTGTTNVTSNERMRITEGGNVGIGNTSPSSKLHIGSGSSLAISGSADELIVDGAGNSGITIGSGTAAAGSLFFADSGSSAAGYVQYNHSSNALIMGTQATERMRIESDGDVILTEGNFTMSGATPFIVLSNTAETESGITFVDSADASQSAKITFNSATDNTLKFYNNASNERMRITPGGNIGIGTTDPDFALDIAASGSGVQLQIGRTSSSAGSTWMGADSSGFHLGVGAYGVGNSVSDPNGFIVSTSGSMLLGFTVFSSLGTANHGVGQEPEGRVTVARGSNGQAIRFYNSTGFAGDITLSGASTSYNTSSDYRLKENVVEMTGALDRVSQLKPSRFNFIADADKTVDGFLAHEVQEIVPEAITGEKDAVDEEGNPEYQGIDQSKLVPLLVGAIKELKADNDNLRERIQTLENQ